MIAGKVTGRCRASVQYAPPADVSTSPDKAVALPQPIAKGVRRIGHDPVHGRDSNVQFAYAGVNASKTITGSAAWRIW